MSLTATCHCGATRITLPTPVDVSTCNCTYCSRAGALWGYFSPEALAVEAMEDRVYAPNVVTKHHFCGGCGMQTHGYSPDWRSAFNDDGTPKQGFDANSVPTLMKAAVNLRLVDDLDLSNVTVTELDGLNNW